MSPRRPARSAALAAPLAALLSACSISDAGPAPAGEAASGLSSPHTTRAPAVHIYLYSAQGLERVSRPYSRQQPNRTQAALKALVEGPTAAERARGLTSAVPLDTAAPVVTARERGTVAVRVPQRWQVGPGAERQLVCTVADAATEEGGAAGVEDILVTVRRGPDSGADPDARSCVR